MNSPKDYLTDRLAEFDELYPELDDIHGMLETQEQKILRTQHNYRIRGLRAFLTETIQQSMEVGRNRIIKEIDKLYGVHNGVDAVRISEPSWEKLLKSLSPKL